MILGKFIFMLFMVSFLEVGAFSVLLSKCKGNPMLMLILGNLLYKGIYRLYWGTLVTDVDFGLAYRLTHLRLTKFSKFLLENWATNQYHCHSPSHRE